MPINYYSIDNMKTPKDLLIYAFQMENQISGLYLFMVSQSPNCEVKESLKLLLQENNNQLHLILNALKDNNDRFDNFDVSEASKETEFVIKSNAEITSAKIAFQMAIGFEKSALKLYDELKRKAVHPSTVNLAQNLIETKEIHIKILTEYMESGIIDKICEQRKRAIYAAMPQPKPTPY